MNRNRQINSKRKIIKQVVLFIALLTCMRLLWIYVFAMPTEDRAVGGVLDLRDRDMAVLDTVSLDGEWEFYPGNWHLERGGNSTMQYIQVPGKWDTSIDKANPTPYGSGSYRLKILVDPEQPVATYSLHVPTARSSSQLFVNGTLLSASGEIGHSQDAYMPLNLPHKVVFPTDDSGEIDVVLEVANFHDARGGGLIRSVKFGSEAAIEREYQLATAFVQMVSVAFMLHIAYAFVLYVIGPRDIRMVYFGCVLICLMLIIVGNTDKVLLNWLELPYTMDFRLKYLAILYTAVFLFLCVRRSLSDFWRNKGSKMYLMGTVAVSIAIVFFPFHWLMEYNALLMGVFSVFYIVSSVLLVRQIFSGGEDMIFALLSFIALANGMVWEYVHTFLNIKIFFYPFDLIIAMFTFACIWVKRYFRSYEETKQFAAKLQQMDKAKDEFLANTSHELRNPLHVILNITEAVLERERDFLKTQSKKDLNTIMNVGRRMSAMLNDLLDISRLREREIQLEVHPVNLRRTVDDVQNLLHYMIEERGIGFSNHIPSSCVFVLADEKRLYQILFNLLQNAVKYTDQGSISVTAELVKDRVYVKVTDTGIGMDSEQRRTVFEPYIQANEGKGGGGFGLGLSISKQLVELHGSELTVDSTLGAGSMFIFYLPVVSNYAEASVSFEDGLAYKATLNTEEAVSIDMGEAIADGDSSIDIINSVDGADTRVIKILAVDDDPVNLEVLATIFEMETYYQVVKTTNPQQALGMLLEQRWDLAIIDVMMPGISGYQLTQYIRERYTVYELPVILVTARVRPEDMEEGFLAGANDYVVKPVNAIELRARVKALTYLKSSVDKRMELEAAWRQAQMKPHFIMNTLNAVMALSDIDIERMRNLVMEFATYLHTSFDFQNSQRVIDLRHELELVRSYLNIEKERFAERLHIQWEVDETINMKIPPLSIQPLVENSINHGILKRSAGGRVCIRIMDLGEYVKFIVEDDGIGMSNDQLKDILYRDAKGVGIGIRNTNLRLKRLYGNGLHVESIEGKGTVVSFVIPKEGQ